MEKHNRKEAQEHLEKAFNLLNKIPVSGIAVDQLAMARQEMRMLYSILQKMTFVEEENDG